MSPEREARSRLRRWLRDGQPVRPAGPDDAWTLFRAARRERLVGLLLDDPATAAWPAGVVEALLAEQRALAVREVWQLDLARRSLAALAGAGVRALALKGAALIGSVYTGAAERPMDDVDLLVLDDWEAAHRALTDFGLSLFERAAHAWSYVEPETGVRLEAHRHVTSGLDLFPSDPESLWNRRTSRPDGIEMPAAEDLLVQAALHAGFQHGWALPLVHYLDVRRLLERCRPDPAGLAERARECGAAPAVWAALRVSEALVGARAGEWCRELDAEASQGLRRHVAGVTRSPERAREEDPLGLLRARWALTSGRRRRWLAVSLRPGSGGVRLHDLGRAAERALRWSGRLGAAALGAPRPVGGAATTTGGRGDPQRLLDPTPEAVRRGFASEDTGALRVAGSCMAPELGDGEVVWLAPPRHRTPRFGDVVLVEVPSGVRLHRLVWAPRLTRRPRWRTKADASRDFDPWWVAPSQVLATAVVSAVGRSPASRLRALRSLIGGIASRFRPQPEERPA